ncbi:MAG: polysaccharide biosynthesis C-terminal domain-containing protein [Sedimentisphaerales bacterium]|nr:polysaccharide biosynthesis C-terminal domain-containing protein [Sedimentisphaerales bacterium]
MVNIIVGLLLTPFIIKHLGKPGYGIWTLVGSFVGYYGLLNLGVRPAIMRYIARYAGQGDERSLNETASVAMVMFCCTGVLVVAASFFLAGPLAQFFEVEPKHFDDFRYVVWIIGLTTGLGFPAHVFGAILHAHERFVVTNCVVVFTTLVRVGLTVYLLLSGEGLLGVALSVFSSQVIGFGANFLLCKYLMPQVHIRLAFAKLRVLRKLIIYGGVATVVSVADIMRGNLDSLVIGKWVSLSMVGIYGIAVIIKGYVVKLVVTGMGVLTPRFAALDGTGKQAEARQLLLKSLFVSSFLSFGGFMMAIVFGGHFIDLWVGKDFADAVTVLYILSISSAFAVSQNPAIGFMYALNKHYLYAIATVIEAIVNLILSILLVSKYGIVGVALGTMIPMLIVKILVMPVYVSKIAGIGMLEYLKPMLLPFIVALVMTLTAYYTGIITQDTPAMGYLICAGMIVGIVYVSACFLVVWKYNPTFIMSLVPGRRVAG